MDHYNNKSIMLEGKSSDKKYSSSRKGSYDPFDKHNNRMKHKKWNFSINKMNEDILHYDNVDARN